MQLSREEGCGQWDRQSVTGFVVMVVVLVGKGCGVGGDEENNEESEETPNTTRPAVLRLASPPNHHPPAPPRPCSKLSGQKRMVGGKRREEGEERGKGAVEGTRAFLFLF